MIETKKKNIRLSIFMLVLLYVTDSGIINFTGNLGYYISLGIILAMGAYYILRYCFNNIYKQHASFIILVIVLIFIAGCSYVFYSGIGPILKYVCLIVTAYYISKIWDFHEFANLYIKICFFIGIVSLVMFAIVFFIPESLDFFPKLNLVSNNTVKVYRTIGFSNMIWHYWEKYPRMYSLFWEPGVCQAYFNVALLFSIQFSRGKKQLIEIALFALCVIATQSSTGYIACMIIMLYFVLFGNKDGRKDILLLQVLVLMGVMVLFINLELFAQTDLYNIVFGKIEQGLDHESFSSRFYSVFGNLRILKEHLICGVGLNNSDYELRRMYSSVGGLHQTNTITNYFATFGLFAGLFFNYCWLAFPRRINCNFFAKIIIWIFFACILSGENFLYSIFFNILMMYGFTSHEEYLSV